MSQPENKRTNTVNIGMPVYNGQKYIREALDSLLGQSFSDFELIISDNASTDGTELICREYAARDARITYVRQQSNIGASANFLYLLERASGRYFMWAACDDKWSREWLERTLDALENTTVDMAFGQVAHIDGFGVAMNHAANGVMFEYGHRASSLMRRLMFYLAFEGGGKANSIHSLYKRDQLRPMVVMWRNIINGNALYDYTIMYDCFGYMSMKQVEYATLFKRVHGESEGSGNAAQESGLIYLARRIPRLIWPFPPGLIGDYFRHSSNIEKLLLLGFLPVKFFVAYLYKLKQLALRLGRRNE